METNAKVVSNTHKCDFCEAEFECKTHRMGDGGFATCECIQLICAATQIDEKGEGGVEAPGRLAFWCSPECHDDDFPQDVDDYDDEEEEEDPDELERIGYFFDLTAKDWKAPE